MPHHLAQVNVAVPLAPIETPLLADFVAALDPVNALADTAPGFVWRLTDGDSNDATSLRAFDDDRILVNMSVWESVESLHAFVFSPEHVALLRRRAEWFEHLREVYAVCWWIPPGTTPTVREAEERIVRCREAPGPEAFLLRKPFPAPTA